MPISQEDAQNLYKSGNISQDTLNSIAPQPELQNTQDLKITDPNAALRVPQGQPVLASNSLIPNIGDTFVEGAKAINDSTITNTDQGYAAPVFANQYSLGLQSKVNKELPQAENAIRSIGETEGKIRGEAAAGNALDIADQRDRIQKAAAEAAVASKESEQAAAEAKAKYDDIYAKAKIDPENYVKQLGVSGKVATGIGLVLSGMGSGLTGQPNMAMQVLQKNIDRDIDAQKAKIAAQFEAVAGQLGVSKQMVNTAQMKYAIINLASAMVYGGAAATTEAAKENVNAQTTQERANLLVQAMQQKVGQYFLNIDNVHKATITGGQKEMNKLITTGLKNFSQYGTYYTPDLINSKNTEFPGLTGQIKKSKPVQSQSQVNQQKQEPKKEKGFMDSVGDFLGSMGGAKQPTSMGE